jgi:ABC-type antimicrobial peptide transport system permease subunit
VDRPSLPDHDDGRRVAAVFFTGLVLVYVFYFRLGWSPAPLGRLDVFYSAPPTITGFYLIDTLIARDFEAFRSALSQLLCRPRRWRSSRWRRSRA